jgi:hypothetical protein
MGKGEQEVPNRTSLDQELPIAQVQRMSVCQSAMQVVALKNRTSRNQSH